MLIAFVFDHKYIKSDQDSIEDAIVSGYPVEILKKYEFINFLGMLGGYDQYFEMSLKLNVKKMLFKNNVCFYMPMTDQFSLVVVSNQPNITSQIILKKKLITLYEMIKFIHGPINPIEKEDEENYKTFKSKLDAVFKVCFDVTFKNLTIPFDSFFAHSSISYDLPKSFRVKCDHLIKYTMKKLSAFTGAIFYKDKLFFSRIKNHLVLNLCYLLTNDTENVIEKFSQGENENRTLPSGCYLMNVHVSKSVLKSLMGEWAATTDHSMEDGDISENNKKTPTDALDDESLSTDLTMDSLPESTRFMENVSKLSAQLSSSDQDKVLLNAFDHVPRRQTEYERENGTFDPESVEDLFIYMQRNSRLKLLLIMRAKKIEDFKYEKIIPIWQKIVTTFSSWECELIELERKANATLEAGSSGRSEAVEEASIVSARTPNLLTSWLVDKNRLVKYSNQIERQLNRARTLHKRPSSATKPITLEHQVSTLVEHEQRQIKTSVLTRNVNFFYDLFEAIPELSKFDVSKRGVNYSYVRKNDVLYVSSSTLCRLSLNDDSFSSSMSSFSPKQIRPDSRLSSIINVNINNKNKPNTTANTYSNTPRQSEDLESTTSTNRTRTETLTSKTDSTNGDNRAPPAAAAADSTITTNDRKNTFFIYSSNESSNIYPTRSSNNLAKSIGSNNHSTSSSSRRLQRTGDTTKHQHSNSDEKLLKHLEYGDVFIRCTRDKQYQYDY